jgi:NAD(P)-dependent dehydrogenase (short-subunit alcohol dehydrogenase family)
MKRIEGKVALITGAASGFGRAGALCFSKEGAKIIVVDRDEAGGRETVEMIGKDGGEAVFVRTDISKADECKNMIKVAVDTYGKLDIIWNNAGIQGESEWDVGHCPIDMIDRYMDINVKGVWYGIRFAAPELVKTKGVVLNTASIVATLGTYGCSTYGTSKGAVRNMTYVVAWELGMYGVRCNCISPYCVETPGTARMGQEHYEHVTSGTALRRLPTVDEVVNAALFLVSDEAKGVTGFDLRVDLGAGVRSMPFIMEPFIKNNTYLP